MARRKYVKPIDPAVYDDPRYAVRVITLSNGIGVLDHREAAAAWDEYEKEHPLRNEKDD